MTSSRTATPADHSEKLDIPAQQEKQKPKTTVLQSLTTGSVAGALEVLVDHPLWSIKTMVQRKKRKQPELPEQDKKKFTLNPREVYRGIRILYRGILPNAASMVPITATQLGLNKFFQNVFFDAKELTSGQRIATAFGAGVGSAVISGPTEMVMTYQQGKIGLSFLAAIDSLVKEAGWASLFRGLSATAIRDGMFTAFFLAVTPMLKAKIQPYCKNDYAASLMAGMGAGVAATLASQGIDTLKTVQQAAPPKQPVGLGVAIKNLYSSEGVYGFFKGGVPRGLRVMSAVTIIGFVSEKLETEFQRRNAEAGSTAEKSVKKWFN